MPKKKAEEETASKKKATEETSEETTEEKKEWNYDKPSGWPWTITLRTDKYCPQCKKTVIFWSNEKIKRSKCSNCGITFKDIILEGCKPEETPEETPDTMEEIIAKADQLPPPEEPAKEKKNKPIGYINKGFEGMSDIGKMAFERLQKESREVVIKFCQTCKENRKLYRDKKGIYKCSVCHSKYEEIPPAGGEEKPPVSQTEANKTKLQQNSTMTGEKIQKTCPGCGSNLKLQHTINTANKKEWLTYNCPCCNYSYKTDKFPARDLPEGHSFNSLWARLVFNYLKKERAL